MRKLFILMATLGLVAASCGGDSGGGCEGVADEAIQIIQEVIDEFDGMSLEEAGQIGEESQLLADLDRRGTELETKADELGCSDSEMDELFSARVGNLKADGILGQFLITELENAGFSDLGE